MRNREYFWRPAKALYPNAARNDPCPCKSGKKFKDCCSGKTVDARRGNFLFLLVVGLLLAGLVLFLVS